MVRDKEYDWKFVVFTQRSELVKKLEACLILSNIVSVYKYYCTMAAIKIKSTAG